MNYLDLGYTGLFVISFLAATLLPLTSEGVLLLFLTTGYDPWLCLAVASTGNTLGGLTNYLIGRAGNPEWLKKRVGKPERFARLSEMVQRYGFWTGALSWLPVIGDPLVLILGFFRTPFIPLLVIMFFARTLRYAILIFLWNA